MAPAMSRLDRPCCDICAVEYSDTVVPRILTECGHTFCHICINRLVKYQSPAARRSCPFAVQCPFDREHTDVPNAEARDLPRNFSLIQVVENLNLADAQAGKTEPEAAPVPQIRRPCHENANHNANKVCEDCKADLCDACCQKLHSFRLFRHHKITDLDAKDLRGKCPIHRDLPINYICREGCCTAKYQLGCRSCFYDGMHIGHRYDHLREYPIFKYAEDEADEQQEEVLHNLPRFDIYDVMVVETEMPVVRDSPKPCRFHRPPTPANRKNDENRGGRTRRIFRRIRKLF